jgi:hypothetical protein
MTAAPTAAGLKLLDAAPSPLQDRFRFEFSKLEEWEQTHMLATLQRIAAMMDAEELEAAPVLTTGAAVTGQMRPESGPVGRVRDPEEQGAVAGAYSIGVADDSRG